MGNTKSKKIDENNEIELLLTETYQNTDLQFSYKEILCFKLRIHDAENYFHTKFDFFFYFNNYLFRERLAILYDNFNNKIEKFSANKYKDTLTVLIDFDDETENIERGSKMDFDSLFTIIFEKLEISTLLFFDMTNVDIDYISDFFYQLVDSVDLYKYNRKFDCLYFLLPNTDIFIKNDCALLYVTNKIIHNKKLFFNEEVNEVSNEYTKALFSLMDKNKLVNARYPEVEANNFIEYFLEKTKPTTIQVLTTFNFLNEVESFILNNEVQFKLVENLIDSCPVNIIIINEVIVNNFKVLKIFIRKIIVLLDKSGLEENVLIVKIVLSKKNKSENKIDLMLLRKYIKFLIINDSNDKFFQNRRKFILEVFDYTPLSNNLTSRNTEREYSDSGSIHNNSKTEYNLDYQKLCFCWYLNSNKMKLDINLCFGVLLRMKKYEKLKNKKILFNIKEFIFANYHSKFNRETKTVTNEELVI